MIALIAATAGAAGPVIVNGQKCGAGGSVAIQEWRFDESCSGPTKCTFQVEVPLDQCGRTHKEAVAYLTGWETHTQAPELTQIQTLGVSIEQQWVNFNGRVPTLVLELEFESSITDRIGHDAGDFVVWFEVLSYDFGAVEVAKWSQSSTDAGDSTVSTYQDPAFPDLSFVGLTKFRVSAERPQGLGNNVGRWGIDGKSTPFAGTTGLANQVECWAEGDSGTPNTSTTCDTAHVAVSTPVLVPAIDQPRSQVFAAPLAPTPAVVGVFANGKGLPACALESFIFAADRPWFGFKYDALGVHVEDCDSNFIQGKMSAQVLADGGYCPDPVLGGSDQSPGASASSCVNVPWTGGFGWSSAGM